MCNAPRGTRLSRPSEPRVLARGEGQKEIDAWKNTKKCLQQYAGRGPFCVGRRRHRRSRRRYRRRASYRLAGVHSVVRHATAADTAQLARPRSRRPPARAHTSARTGSRNFFDVLAGVSGKITCAYPPHHAYRSPFDRPPHHTSVVDGGLVVFVRHRAIAGRVAIFAKTKTKNSYDNNTT